MKKLEGYSPLNPKQTERIIAGWQAYRETFGLECEEQALLTAQAYDATTVEQKLQARKKLLDELLPLWESEWLNDNQGR